MKSIQLRLGVALAVLTTGTLPERSYAGAGEGDPYDPEQFTVEAVTGRIRSEAATEKASAPSSADLAALQLCLQKVEDDDLEGEDRASSEGRQRCAELMRELAPIFTSRIVCRGGG